MLTESEVRTIRQLAVESYGINFKSFEDEVPTTLNGPFSALKVLSQKRFDHYFANVRPDQYSVRESIAFVKFLQEKASSLMRNATNESEWRHKLEHHILRRLGSEVTWCV